MHPKMTPSRECHAVIFCVCSDHYSNSKNISTKLHKKMLNRFHEEKERKKALQKWVKITQNASSPGEGDRCEFFYRCDHLSNDSEFQKKILSHSQKMVEHIQRDIQTDKLKQTVLFDWLATEVRILKYDWLREFWVITWKPKFSQNVKGV